MAATGHDSTALSGKNQAGLKENEALLKASTAASWHHHRVVETMTVAETIEAPGGRGLKLKADPCSTDAGFRASFLCDPSAQSVLG